MLERRVQFVVPVGHLGQSGIGGTRGGQRRLAGHRGGFQRLPVGPHRGVQATLGTLDLAELIAAVRRHR